MRWFQNGRCLRPSPNQKCSLQLVLHTFEPLFSENLFIFSWLIQRVRLSIWRMSDVLCVHCAHTVPEETSPALWLRPRTLWRCSPWYTWLPPSSPLRFPRWATQRQNTMWFCLPWMHYSDVNQSSLATVASQTLGFLFGSEEWLCNSFYLFLTND